jgi:hypothetical protein
MTVIKELSQLDLTPDAFEPQLITKSKYYTTTDFLDLNEKTDFSDSLSIFNVNCRSLCKHYSEYELYFETLKSEHFNSFDILTFTETWLDDHLQDIVQFDNYHSIFKHKDKQKEGGGLAVYIKDEFNFKKRNDLAVPTEKQQLFDTLFIEISHPSYKSSIILGILYRSPSYNSVEEFTSYLKNTFDLLSDENKEIILLGDTNIDLLKYGTNQLISRYLDSLISSSFCPVITVPTRTTSTSATLIDHIFKKQSDCKYLGGTLLNDISDHYPNFMYLFLNNKKRTNPKYVTYRPFTDRNIQSFKADLMTHNWNNVLDITNPCHSYDEFVQTFNHYLDKCIPQKTIRFNKFKHKKENWVTRGLLKSMKTKNLLYSKMKNEINPGKRNELETKYKQYRNKLNQLIRAAKKVYWENSFKSSENDMKATWQNLNKVLNRSKNTSKLPEIFKHENTQYTSPQSISDGFNTFFTNIGPNLAQKIPDTPTDPIEFLPHVNLTQTFVLIPTTNYEVEKILNKLHPKLSYGHDTISPKLVKITQDAIIKPLVHIINQSLLTGIVPKNMKLAKIVPIFKNGDNSCIKNYRPISLLPTFSKLLERIVYNRLYKYLTINNLLSPCQYGFQKNKSTDLAILELQDRITSAITNKLACVGIFLDLSKAFDTLNHSLLLKKLEHYGIRGLAQTWFRSYLDNRRQFTCTNNINSDPSAVTCGVPQGSILGPLLFLVYINDITNISNDSDYHTILFADDTNLIFEHENPTTLIKIINKELIKISNWFLANKLSLNTDKTKYISFGKNKINQNSTNLTINGDNIAEVTSISFLGVTIQDNLKWNIHIQNKSNKVAKVNSILYRLKHVLPENVMINIYNALVLPHLTYAIAAWGDSNRSLLRRLTILQKKCLRTIANVKYNSHTDPLFKKYRMLKLQDIFRINCCKLFYRTKLNTLPTYHSGKLPSLESIFPHFSRHSSNIYVYFIRNTLQKQLINYKVGSQWNHLPENIKEISNISAKTFSKRLKCHFISLYNQPCLVQNCRSCNCC